MQYLSFGTMVSNAKLAKHMSEACTARGLSGRLLTFSLPAGFSCPAALDCMSHADRVTGRITDGPQTQFRCYAASQESRRANVRESRWRNFELLQATYRDTPNEKSDALASLILASLAHAAGRSGIAAVRIHVSGDFYNRAYFNAWRGVAFSMPRTHFYAYTKAAVPYMAQYPAAMPDNLRLIASRGGRYDHLIDAHNLREARVVYSRDEAIALGLAIDEDDTIAAFGAESFALLIHGTQPKGSHAAKAVSALKLHAID